MDPTYSFIRICAVISICEYIVVVLMNIYWINKGGKIIHNSICIIF